MNSPLRRHEANPILTRDDLAEPRVLVFNAGVVAFGGRFLMAFRADHGTWENPFITNTDVGFAWSDDGVEWSVDEQVFDRDRMIELLTPLEPNADLERALWRMYDPRLSVIDDGGPLLALSFAVDTTHGVRPGLAVSRDGRDWRAVSLGAPDNRNNVLFPTRIGGRWMRLERPMHRYGGEAMGDGNFGIWTSASPDLVHWGDTRFVCDHQIFPYADTKIGPGAPPIETEAGWLCIVHVVATDPKGGKRGWEPAWDRTYHAAAILLDRDDPSRLVAAAPQPLLSPDPAWSYETTGYRHDVIFPTAAVVVGEAEPELWVYYGAADTVVALATASVADVLDFVTSG